MTGQRVCSQCGTRHPSNAVGGVCPKCLLKLGLEKPGGVQATTNPYRSDQEEWSVSDLEARFPDLEILGLIGRGGMGAVYEARQKNLDRIVALKVLPARAGGDPSFAERFVREARTLAKLNHPNIVTVHEFGEKQGVYFILMEYVDGVNLRSLMSANTLTSQEALSIIGQVCDALQYAHELSIVHRDIKPENVLIDQRGQVKIADFGLAKILERPVGDITLTGAHQVVGTPHYMAPEQMEKPTEVDHRADIYSLGVVFYELLTGELPIGRFAPPSSKAQVHSDLDEVVLRTLEKEPSHRFQRASEIKSAMSQVDSPRGERTLDRKPQTQRQRAITVPCKLPTQWEGLFEYNGILKLTDGRLVLQYQGKDGIVGANLLNAEERIFPIDQVAAIEFRMGFTGNSLDITFNDLHVTARIPGSSHGKVRLTIAREDRAQAEALVRECEALGVDQVRIPTPVDEAEARSVVKGPAIGMLVFAALSMSTSLAAGVAAITKSGNSFNDVLAAIATTGILFTIVHAFIIFGATHMLRLRNRNIAFGAAIACCVPSSPWSLLGIGMGIWALVVLRRQDLENQFDSKASYSIEPEMDGKPRTDASIQLEAAQRLQLCTTGLRFCGQLTLVGTVLFAATASILAQSDFLEPFSNWVGGRPFFWLWLLPALSYVSLIQAKPHTSRWGLFALCALGLAPISPLWPISMVFALWCIVTLMDPDVQFAQDQGELPRVGSSASMLSLFWGGLVAVVVALLTIGASTWMNEVKSGRVMATYEYTDPSVSEERIAEATEKIANRFTSANVEFEIRQMSLADRLDSPSLNFKFGAAKRDKPILDRLVTVVGKIEVALMADDDVDSAEVDSLPISKTPGNAHRRGWRLAVLRSTRIALDEKSVKLIAAKPKEDQESQNLELEFSAPFSERLAVIWEPQPDDADDAQNEPDSTESSEPDDALAVLIVDDVAVATGRMHRRHSDSSKTKKYAIEVAGHLPLHSNSEWRAVLDTGPLPVSLREAD